MPHRANLQIVHITGEKAETIMQVTKESLSYDDSIMSMTDDQDGQHNQRNIPNVCYYVCHIFKTVILKFPDLATFLVSIHKCQYSHCTNVRVIAN